jgi:hypothetical protein
VQRAKSENRDVVVEGDDIHGIADTRVSKLAPAISESISDCWASVKYVTVTSRHHGGRHLSALDDPVA